MSPSHVWPPFLYLCTVLEHWQGKSLLSTSNALHLLGIRSILAIFVGVEQPADGQRSQAVPAVWTRNCSSGHANGEYFVLCLLFLKNVFILYIGHARGQQDGRDDGLVEDPCMM